MFFRTALGALALAGALVTSVAAETLLERGDYLMSAIVACGNCHTPRGADAGMELAGGFVIEQDAFTAYAPNITPDRETGIGGWSDDQIIDAIRNGRRPDGSIIGPPMPILLYRGISDRDVAAIIAYLRAVPAVRNRVPKSVYRMPLPRDYGPTVDHVAEVPRDAGARYGAYLAGPLGHCMECHTPIVRGRPLFDSYLGAGGNSFNGPWGSSVSANITPHPVDGIGGRSDQEIKNAISLGLRPDGGHMLPPMGYAYYKNLGAADLDSIVAYLRSLEPKAAPTDLP